MQLNTEKLTSYISIEFYCITCITPAATPLYNGQQLCKVLSPAKLPVKGYGPETNFCYGYAWTVTLILVQCNMTQSESQDTIVLNITQIKHDSKEFWVWQRCWLIVYCHLDLWNMTLGQGHVTHTPFGSGQSNGLKYYQDPTWQWGVRAQTPFWSMYALWPGHCRYDLGSR